MNNTSPTWVPSWRPNKASTWALSLTLSLSTLGTASVASGQDEPRPLPVVQDHSEVQRGIEVMRRVLWKSIQGRSSDIQGYSAAAQRYNRLYQEGLVSGNTLQEYVRSNYGMSSANQGSSDYLPGLAAVLRFEMPIRGRWVRPEAEAQEEDPAPPEDLWEQSLDEVEAAQEGRSSRRQVESLGVPILSELPVLGHYFSNREAEALTAQAQGALFDAMLEAQQGQLEVDPTALRDLLDTLGSTLAQYSRRIGLRDGEDLVVCLQLSPRAAASNYRELARMAATASDLEEAGTNDLTTVNGISVTPWGPSTVAEGSPSSGGAGTQRTLVLRVPAAALKGGHEQSEAAFVSQLRIDYF